MGTEDSARVIKLLDVVKIILKSNASAGYVWNLATSDFQIISVVPVGSSELHHLPVGTSVDMVYTLKPLRVGALQLRFELRRPWEKNTGPVNVYEEEIIVSE